MGPPSGRRAACPNDDRRLASDLAEMHMRLAHMIKEGGDTNDIFPTIIRYTVKVGARTEMSVQLRGCQE